MPKFREFSITENGLYLGFIVGPVSKNVQWTRAIDKWLSRAKCIASSRMSPSLAAVSYNIRGLPVLGYIAQLVPPPVHIHRKEFNILYNMLLQYIFPHNLLNSTTFSIRLSSDFVIFSPCRPTPLPAGFAPPTPLYGAGESNSKGFTKVRCVQKWSR